MNSSLASHDIFGSSAHQINLESMMDELVHQRKQARNLRLINELHGRLAGAVDLQAIVEAFSVWLTPLVEHDLVAYHNSVLGKRHLSCSCHGAERQAAIQVADKIFNRLEHGKAINCWQEEAYLVHSWQFTGANDANADFLIMGQGFAHDSREMELVNEAVSIMGVPLRRAAAHEDLFLQARQDSLTGLANRRVFEERIGAMLESADRYDHPISVASMDLDYFKQINDSMGHAAGDLVLRKVANLLAGLIRKCDLLVRMGGDEFVLVLPDTSLNNAQILARRLCEAVAGMDLGGYFKARPGISIGLAQWQKGQSCEQWLQRADENLYQAKADGRSRFSAE
ncbi:MAG: diguanylate cyclase [Proteobacteria bacterium]|nr:diguanylate cyclase [Pseudomonadota bacterium]MBU1715777.1 diguanylate cyclase [Pseudomonadota bacterium]